MKKLLLTIALGAAALALPALAGAQQYVVSQSPISYTPLSGATTQVGISGDDDAELVTLPFTFSFFGTDYTEIGVNTNGLVTFGTTPSTSYSNTSIPSSGSPNAIVAAWWDDSSVASAADVVYATLGSVPNREFIVQWSNWPHLGGNQTRELQVHLYEGSNVIQVQYGANAGASDSASVGIEDETGATGDVGLACTPNCSSGDWPASQMIQFGVSNEPDVTPMVAIGPTTTAGGSLSFTVETSIRNLGLQDATPVRWDIYLSADASLDPAADTLLGQHTTDLTVPGQGIQTASDPVTTVRPAPGQYWVCVLLDPGNLVAEANESNNRGCTPSPFLIGADLLGSISLPARGAPGELVPFDVHVQNRGTDSTPSFDYRLWLSADGSLDGGDTLVHTNTIQLAGTDSHDAVDQVLIPTTIGGTEFYAILDIDPGAAVAEADEANNTAISPGQISLIKSDLRLRYVRAEAPAGCFFGEPMTVEFEVCNEGGGNAWNFVDSVYLSDNAIITGNDPEIFARPQSCPGGADAECGDIGGGAPTCTLGTCRAPCAVGADCGGSGLACGPDATCQNHLAPAECRTFRETFTVPRADAFGVPFAPGDYFIGLITDSVDQVNEENEGNNIKRTDTAFLCREPAMDVLATQIAPPPRLAGGEATPVFRVLRNAGNLQGSFAYRFYLSTNDVVSAGDVPVDVIRADGTIGEGMAQLRAYSEDQATERVVVGAHVVPGDYYLGIVVDPQNLVPELDERNNVLVYAGQVRVEPASLRVTTSSLPDATIGVPYTRQLVAAGGDGSYQWTADATALPPGLAMSAEGVLSGTPTALGTSAFEVRVASGGSTANALLALRVGAPTSTLSVATEVLPPGILAHPYEAALAAVGGQAPYTWTVSAGVLPAGLSLQGGVITGTPSATGSAEFTVRATDSVGNAAVRPLVLQVVTESDLIIISPRFEEGAAGEPYLGCVQAQGGDGLYTWDADAATAPPGLAFRQEGSRGCLDGEPISCGTYLVRVTVRDGAGQSDTGELPLQILCDSIRLETDRLEPVHRGDAVEVLLTTTGRGTVELGVLAGELPAGLELDERGLLSGTVEADALIGRYNFVVELHDAEGGSGLGALSIEVLPDAPGEEAPPAAGGGGSGCGCTAGAGPARGLFALGALALVALFRARGREARRAKPRKKRVFSREARSGNRAARGGPIAGHASRGLRRRALTDVIEPGRLVAALALASVLLPAAASAQNGYTVQRRAVTYTPIVGGTAVGISGDDDAATISLGFDVVFYGQSYNQVGVSTNGLVTFGGESTDYSNESIPDPNPPDNMIAAWWCDSAVDSVNDVQWVVNGSAPAREVVIQWSDWSHLSGSNSRNLQVHLFEGSSSIELHYGSIVDMNEDSCSVGIEDATASALSAVGLACTPGCAESDWPTGEAVTFTQGADLIVSRVTGDAIGYAGVAMHVEAQVTNAGGRDAAAFGARWFVGPSAQRSPADRELGRSAVPQPAVAGQSVTFTEDVTLPADLPPGQYFILAEADPDDAVDEDNEANNVGAYGPFPLGVPAPDLSVRGLTVPARATPGGSFDVTWELENEGNDDATGVPWALVLSENDTITDSDAAIHEATADVARLAVRELTARVTLPRELRSGTYTIGIVIDPRNEVHELDELDNVAVSPVPFVVASDRVDIVTTTLPPAQVGAPYCKLLQALGGDGAFTWTAGPASSLPPGLSLVEDPAQARDRGEAWVTLLCGTPGAAGTFPFELVASSAGAQASAELVLEVEPATAPLAIATFELPAAAFGTGYRASLDAVGGTPPYAWSQSAGSLPPGIALRADGWLEGEALEDGNFSVGARVTDATGAAAERLLELSVVPPGRLTCATRELLPGRVGEPHVDRFYAAGGTRPHRWANLESLRLAGSPGEPVESFPGAAPPGLVLSDNGTFSGVPSQAGRYLWTVIVEDATASASTSCTALLRVGFDQGISVITSALPEALVDEDYRAQLEAAGGEGFLTWRLLDGSELPEGLALAPDGAIEGALGAELLEDADTRMFAFAVEVTDSQNRSGIAGLSIRLRRPAPPPARDAAPVADDGGGCQAAGPGALEGLGIVVAALLTARRRRKL